MYLETVTCELDVQQALELLKSGKAVLKYVSARQELSKALDVKPEKEVGLSASVAAKTKALKKKLKTKNSLSSDIKWIISLYEDSETHKETCGIIQGMGQEFWEIFDRLHLRNQKTPEIAQSVGRSIVTVRNRLQSIADACKSHFGPK